MSWAIGIGIVFKPFKQSAHDGGHIRGGRAMRSFLTQPRRKLKRSGVALILQIIPLAGSLLMTPMGLAPAPAPPPWATSGRHRRRR